MMNDLDSYLTLSAAGEGAYTEKRSRFLAFALPVDSEETAKAAIKQYGNDFHDARHVCWAYVVGADRSNQRSSDDGEPSGTAGRPILGQINSAGLTDVAVIVVRYFGGIKLGVPGLIAAYKEAARLALEGATVVKRQKMETVEVEFAYEEADRIMRIVKQEPSLQVISREFDNICKLKVAVPASQASGLRGKLG